MRATRQTFSPVSTGALTGSPPTPDHFLRPPPPVRLAAKLHHPDARRAAAATHHDTQVHILDDLAAFKLINEANAVLGNPALRRDYDNERFGRTATLRARNEGGGLSSEIDRPTSVYQAGNNWTAPLKGTPAAGGPVDAAASTSSSSAVASSSSVDSGAAAYPGARFTAEDSREAFRVSMERASERQRETQRFRANLARMNRTRLDLPSTDASMRRLLVPVAVAGLWAVNYFLFMR